AAQRQSLLLELCLVPVAVADDDVARLRGFYPIRDPGKQFVHRAHPRQVHAGTAARVVQVTVGESGRDGAAAGVNDLRRGANVKTDRGRVADCGYLPGAY